LSYTAFVKASHRGMCMSLSEFGRANAGASTSAATSNAIDGFVAIRATHAIPYETFHVLNGQVPRCRGG
jgi:hypothetical protein